MPGPRASGDRRKDSVMPRKRTTLMLATALAISSAVLMYCPAPNVMMGCELQ